MDPSQVAKKILETDKSAKQVAEEAVEEQSGDIFDGRFDTDTVLEAAQSALAKSRNAFLTTNTELQEVTSVDGFNVMRLVFDDGQGNDVGVTLRQSKLDPGQWIVDGTFIGKEEVQGIGVEFEAASGPALEMNIKQKFKGSLRREYERITGNEL